ncbi:MAG: hypothetical protein KJ060_17745 [Candidatus Hydrogenedentes bacterium]|nr:hypothetical protein [Candidatus Hydrogenedentota bacterium]
MPELPEVEIRRRYLVAHALHRPILRTEIADPTLLNGASARSFRKALAGHALVDTFRHGKWLFVQAESLRWIALHLGMTGNLRVIETAATMPRYVRLRLRFRDGGSLVFTDPRKFGEAHLVENVTAFLQARKWGPDPTLDGFDRDAFRERLRGRSGVLKGILLNQQVIAGIGNLYADEMLFQCGLHPDTRASGLKPRTFGALYDAMMEIFEASIAVETRYKELPNRFLLRHRNYDGLCPKCRRPLNITTAGSRTTYYCPTHQRRRG